MTTTILVQFVFFCLVFLTFFVVHECSDEPMENAGNTRLEDNVSSDKGSREEGEGYFGKGRVSKLGADYASKITLPLMCIPRPCDGKTCWCCSIGNIAIRCTEDALECYNTCKNSPPRARTNP
ncbi:uncharacterized protein LOC130772209 [Actinidia eriantha]|uniref:uncharacterized protein LOC130772209 n=1 Tax=Actinidia eriantha TaxID=165200 RepID=UPI002590567A|nr:uncharacterized protein LOC130772209 [Actinidia eriantha]